jgi:hypothetical protein
MKKRTEFWIASLSICAALLLAPAGSRAQSKGETVEEIIARVNNEIITMSDYRKASAGLLQEAQQDCQNCTPEQIQTEVKEHQKDLLRDMIDQQLLIERAKDMDLNMESSSGSTMSASRTNWRPWRNSRRPWKRRGLSGRTTRRSSVTA